jgi:hypothetical protein
MWRLHSRLDDVNCFAHKVLDSAESLYLAKPSSPRAPARQNEASVVQHSKTAAMQNALLQIVQSQDLEASASGMEKVEA